MVPVDVEMFTPHAIKCPLVSRKIIAVDNSNKDYGFGYNGDHEDHMPVNFKFTTYDPMAEEKQQLPPEPEPEPELRLEPKPQLTANEPQPAVPQQQISPQVDERIDWKGKHRLGLNQVSGQSSGHMMWLIVLNFLASNGAILVMFVMGSTLMHDL